MMSFDELQKNVSKKVILAYRDKELDMIGNIFTTDSDLKVVMRDTAASVIKGQIKPEIAFNTELWILGEIDEKGCITPQVPEMILDLANYIKGSDANA